MAFHWTRTTYLFIYRMHRNSCGKCLKMKIKSHYTHKWPLNNLSFNRNWINGRWEMSTKPSSYSNSSHGKIKILPTLLPCMIHPSCHGNEDRSLHLFNNFRWSSFDPLTPIYSNTNNQAPKTTKSKVAPLVFHILQKHTHKLMNS